MLLLLLLISTGCDVNIPGCGKRSLPFFKPVTPEQVSKTVINAPATPASMATPSQTVPQPSSLTSSTLANPTSKQPVLDTSMEMSITKPKPTATATATSTATPQEVEKFAFTTIEQDKPTLWIMNTDGTDRTRLTPVGTSSWFPLWSPNGKLLAFLSDMKDGKMNLFILKKGTTEIQQITFFEDMSFKDASNLKPPFSWSPRSDEMVFYYHNQIWKIGIDAFAQESIAMVDPNFSISAIEWAPHRDNKYVAYLVKRGINYFGLKLTNPRLKDDLKLADSSLPLSDISWSSDARDVAYISNNTVIYSASAQTSLPKILLSMPSSLLGPLVAFSPSESGTTLMVLAQKDPGESGYRVAIIDKYATDTDPGSLKYLTEPGVDDAIWSPDGNKIAYLQSGELWVMDALTGANKKRIAATGILSPCWSKK
jgi:dipeptidyl aminopeptidase/acylaminoacyl peptidase